MEKLISSIVDDKKKKGISNKIIAKKTNLSPATISNYFNNVWTIPFNKFVDIISIIYSEDEDKEKKSKLIEQFLRKTKKLENLKEAAEWLLITNQTQKAIKLINKCKKQYPLFLVYEQIAKRSNREVAKEDFYKEIESLRDSGNKQKDFLSYLKMAHIYSVHDFRGFDMMDFLAGETLNYIHDLNNEFLKESLSLRVIEAKTLANLMKGNLGTVERDAIKIVNTYPEEKYPLQIASFYGLLSERYLFDDYETAINYNKDAFRTMRNSFGDSKYRQAVLENTHDFIKIYHGKYDNLYMTSITERAHFYAKTGNRDKALVILDEIEHKNKTLSPFQLYYKAIALDSKELYNRAKHEFIRSGNIHYMRLVENI